MLFVYFLARRLPTARPSFCRRRQRKNLFGSSLLLAKKLTQVKSTHAHPPPRGRGRKSNQHEARDPDHCAKLYCQKDQRPDPLFHPLATDQNGGGICAASRIQLYPLHRHRGNHGTDRGGNESPDRRAGSPADISTICAWRWTRR